MVKEEPLNQGYLQLLNTRTEGTDSSGHRLIWWGDAISICTETNASKDHIV